MIESMYYPEGAEFDHRAPFNEEPGNEGTDYWIEVPFYQSKDDEVGVKYRLKLLVQEHLDWNYIKVVNVDDPECLKMPHFEADAEAGVLNWVMSVRNGNRTSIMFEVG